MMRESLMFDDFEQAFDYCREKDQPVTVFVEAERWKLYPSGHAEFLGKATGGGFLCDEEETP